MATRTEKITLIKNLLTRKITLDELGGEVVCIAHQMTEGGTFEVSRYGAENKTFATREEYNEYMSKHPKWKFITLVPAKGCEPLKEID